MQICQFIQTLQQFSKHDNILSEINILCKIDDNLACANNRQFMQARQQLTQARYKFMQAQ